MRGRCGGHCGGECPAFRGVADITWRRSTACNLPAAGARQRPLCGASTRPHRALEASCVNSQEASPPERFRPLKVLRPIPSVPRIACSARFLFHSKESCCALRGWGCPQGRPAGKNCKSRASRRIPRRLKLPLASRAHKAGSCELCRRELTYTAPKLASLRLCVEVVAGYLQDEAIRRIPNAEADQFARSAFNRYYYAAFLEVKAKLGALRPEWANQMQHAAMPELLRGQVKHALTVGRKQASRADDHKIAQMCQDACRAAVDLAELLDEGRATRVTADYHPNIPVEFIALSDFELNKVGVKRARHWPQRAKVHMTLISNAWRQIHA